MPWRFGDVGAMVVHQRHIDDVKKALSAASSHARSRRLGKKTGTSGWYNKNASTWRVSDDEFAVGVTPEGAAALQTPGHVLPDPVRKIMDKVKWVPGLRRPALGKPPAAPADERRRFAFVDLFAGIGGFRLGCQEVGGQSVFAVEKDPYCRDTYAANYGEEPNVRDVTQLHTSDVPEHDLLVAGFPCGPFTAASGPRRQGFGDPRGLLYLQIARVLEDCRPKAFLLENVPGVLQGKQALTIATALRSVGYAVEIFLSSAEGVTAQQRRRVFFAGVREDLGLPPYRPPVSKLPGFGLVFGDIKQRDLSEEALLSHVVAEAQLQRYRARTFNRYLARCDEQLGPLMSSYRRGGPDGLTQLVEVAAGATNGEAALRFLTERECARAQGFPDDFTLSKERGYDQVGNAVPPPLVSVVAWSVVSHVLHGGSTDEEWRCSWPAAARLALRAVNDVEAVAARCVALPNGEACSVRELSLMTAGGAEKAGDA